MIQPGTTPLPELYAADETAWLDEMADLIHQGRLEDLDYAHLAEYLSDMARRDRKEVKSRLTTLLEHVLKYVHQPERRTPSWRHTIMVQRDELEDDVSAGVLRNHAFAVLSEAYAKAVARVAKVTGLPTATFPAECPYTLEQLMSPEFPPE